MFLLYFAVFQLVAFVVSSSSRLHRRRLAVGMGFDWEIGNTSLWLSAAAYCETNTYLNRTYEGPSTGFIPLHTIDNPTYDVQVITIFFLLHRKILP